MNSALLFAMTGAGLFCLGLHALVVHAHLLRRVLALNVMGSGTFLALVGLAQRLELEPDPVPHALVLTGIVVAVSASALALSLLRQLAAAEDGTELEENRDA